MSETADTFEPESPSVAATASSQTEFARNNSRLAAITGLSFVVFNLAVRHIPANTGLIFLTTLISLFATLLFTVLVARSLGSNRSLAATAIVSIGVILPSILIPLLFNLAPSLPIWARLAIPFRTYRNLLHAVPGVDGLIMVAAAVSIGVAISRLVKEFKMLLPIAVMLALVDLYVVFGGGLVTQAQHGNAAAAHLMNSLTVKLPTAHPAQGVAPMQLAVGFADYLFIGLFFGCFASFRVPAKRTFTVLFITLALYMTVVAFKNIALPALVPIAVVVVGMHLKRFNYKRDELFALLYAGLIVGAIGAFFFFKSRVGVK